MEIKETKYEIKDGQVEVTESVKNDNSPQIQRIEKMALAAPGRIVMGIKMTKDDQVQCESEQYLKE